MSIFILSGSQLKAIYSLEGPFEGSEADALHIYNNGQGFANEVKLGNKREDRIINFMQEVDFEHLMDEVDDDAFMDDDDDDDDEYDDDEPIKPDEPNAEEKRRQRRERQRKKFLAAKKKREEKKAKMMNRIRQDGEPIMSTFKAPSSGWYRMCVTASWNQVRPVESIMKSIFFCLLSFKMLNTNACLFIWTIVQIVAEMEMRKESDLGGLNEDGHVWTYEERKMADEDIELEEDSAAAEGIKDEDFQETRDKVKDLRRLLNDIMNMQQKERRRLTVHAETNEHSHSSMVLNSLMETLLFMAVTGYQVYTIRKWFSGAPVLGR